MKMIIFLIIFLLVLQIFPVLPMPSQSVGQAHYTDPQAEHRQSNGEIVGPNLGPALGTNGQFVNAGPSVGRSVNARKDVNIMKLANCPQYKNQTVIYKNVVLTRNKQGKTASLRFDLLYKTEVKRMVVTATLQKCDNPENLDSCEYYMRDFKIKNACDIIGKQNQIWSEALSNSNFPRSCPTPAGMYHLNNSNLDSSLQLTLMPVPIALWNVRLFMFDAGNDNIMVCCTDLDVKVYNVRRS